MRGGFLSGGNSRPKAQQPVKKTEDLTHIKAKPKDETLKINEVQDAMTSTLLKNKNEWLTPDFMTKLASNPMLIKAFSNPQYMQAFTEFG